LLRQISELENVSALLSNGEDDKMCKLKCASEIEHYAVKLEA